MLITKDWKTLITAKGGSSSNILWTVDARLVSQSKPDNKSTFELRLTAKALSGSGSSSGVSVSGDINQDLGFVSINSALKVWATKTLTITHNSEGKASKNVNVKVTASGFKPLGTDDMTGILEFPQIPRESTVSASFGDNIDGKAKAIITISKKYSGFTSTVWVKYGKQTKTLGTKTKDTSFTLQIPLDWIKEYPSKEKEKAYAYVDTYSGDIKIGETKSDYFTVWNPPVRTLECSGAPVGSDFKLTVKRNEKYAFLTDKIYLRKEGSDINLRIWENPSTTDLGFVIPTEWANEFPNSKSLRWYAYIETYYDGVKIGKTFSDYATITVPDSAKADGTNQTVTELNEKVLAKGQGITLIGLSKKRLSINVKAKLGASIKSVTVKQNSNNIATLNLKSGDTYESESVSMVNGSYIFSIVDSRGLVTEIPVNETSYVYAPINPKLSISRTVPTANKGTLKAHGTMFNQLDNHMNITVKIYQNNDQNEDGSVVKKTPVFSHEANSVDFNYSLDLENTLYENNYTLVVTFKDDFTELTQKIDFLSSVPVWWLGKRTVRVNDYLIVKKDASVGGKRILNGDSFIVKSFDSFDNGQIKGAEAVRQTFDILAPDGYKFLMPLFAQATKHRDIACTIENFSGDKVNVLVHNYNNNWVCPDSYARLYCLFVRI